CFTLPPSDTTQFWFAAVVCGMARSSAYAADPKTSKAIKTTAAWIRRSAERLSLPDVSFIVVSNSGRPAIKARSLVPEQRGVETMLLQNLLAVVRENVKRQSGSRPRRVARFQQGQSIFRTDRELSREFHDPAFRQLALKR